MTRRLPLLPDVHIVLPPLLLPSVPVMALIAAVGEVTFDFTALFDKRRKEAHRYTIADTRGPLRLTVPISHPHGIRRAAWTDVSVSAHGEWWAVHRTAWESAYGRTPFFEFYIDDFAELLRAPAEGLPLVELHRAANNPLFRLAGIETKINYLTEGAPSENGLNYDPTEIIVNETPYWQVRADKLGFLPAMSGIDMLFNVGPDMPLLLLERIKGSQLLQNLEARQMAPTL